MNFEGKTVLVTGANGGLGFATAQRFLADGANVACMGRNKDRITKAISKLCRPDRTMPVIADVSDSKAVQNAVDEVVLRWGRIDVLANIAGIAEEYAFLDCPLKSWKKIIDINLTGMFIVDQIVARQMVKQGDGGVIINMSSKNGIVAEVGYAAYNASKGGIELLTKTMAVELAQCGIRVHSVAPGYIVTPLAEELDDPEFQKHYAKKLIPLNRLGKSEEVAGVFVFLASPDASFMTGETIVIDGGHTCFDGRKEINHSAFMDKS